MAGRGLKLLGQGVAVDAQFPGSGAVVALVGRQNLLEVHPLELAPRQFQRDAATHHFGYEYPQLLAHSIFSKNRIGSMKVAPR